MACRIRNISLLLTSTEHSSSSACSTSPLLHHGPTRPLCLGGNRCRRYQPLQHSWQHVHLSVVQWKKVGLLSGPICTSSIGWASPAQYLLRENQFCRGVWIVAGHILVRVARDPWVSRTESSSLLSLHFPISQSWHGWLYIQQLLQTW